jgi:hypothetical protein
MRKEESKTIKPPFVVVCINDSNRPQEIPSNLWVTKGQRYTVIQVKPSLDGQIGFVLEELPLGEDTIPFDSFGSKRFGIPMDQISIEEEAEQALKELTEELQLQPV